MSTRAKPAARPRRTGTKAGSATASTLKRYKVERLDQVRLLAHPLRLRLFEAFALGPRTTHQVAQSLGLAPTRLYHHVNALERVGLLQLKETRQVRGATEKYYQSAGRMIDIEPALFGRAGGGTGAAAGTRDVIEAMMGHVIEPTRAELAEALSRQAETPDALKPVAARLVFHASPARLATIRRRVIAWLEQCSKPARRRGSKAGAAAGAAAGGAEDTQRGAASGGGRASLTLVFTTGPGSVDRSD